MKINVHILFQACRDIVKPFEATYNYFESNRAFVIGGGHFEGKSSGFAMFFSCTTFYETFAL